MLAKLKQFAPWLICLAIVGAAAVHDYGPAVTMPDWTSWLSANKTPAAWVVIVRDEASQTHEQAKAWDSSAARKVMADAKVQYRLLDPKQKESMPSAFWPWLERAAAVKSNVGVILMADESGKILDAASAPQTEAEFLSVLHSKGKLP